MSEEYKPKGITSPILSIYSNKPSGVGPFPTIVVFMHAHGVDASMKKVCDDLADAGYYAICADAYLKEAYSFQTRSDDVIFATFDLLLFWMEKQEEIDADRMGIMGFCMGGRHTYLAITDYPQFKAGVSYYGFPHRGSSAEDTPQDLIEEFNAPILSIFGSEDQGIPMDAVNNYREVSEEQDLDHVSVVFEGAGHGFLNPYSSNHHEEASREAWKLTLEHFETYLTS